MIGSAGSPLLGQSNTARSVAVVSRSSHERFHSPAGVDGAGDCAAAAWVDAGGTQAVNAATEASRPAFVTKSRRELRFAGSDMGFLSSRGGCADGLRDRTYQRVDRQG